MKDHEIIRGPRLGVALLATLVLTGLSASLSASLGAQEPPPESPPPGTELVLDSSKLPEIVARVNGHEITRDELLIQAEIAKRQMGGLSGVPAPRVAAFYREVLEGLIGEVLVYDFAREAGKGATDAEIDTTVAKMREKHESEAAFQEALAAQGTDLASLRGQLERALTVEKYLFSEVGSQVTIPEEKKKAFYEANRERMRLPERRRVRHILVAVPDDAPAELRTARRARAAEALEKLKAGGDFAALATQYSDDVDSSEKGGELPWIHQAGIVPAFEKAIFELEQGQTSGVVESSAGYHVIELLEIQPGRSRPFEEVEKKITELLRDREIRRLVQAQVEKLRAEAEVEILI